MAFHLRKQIRAAFISTVSGLATTGANVFDSRPDDYNLFATELPALHVNAGGETPTVASLGVSRIFERPMRIKVKILVRKNTGYADDLDQILKELEVAVAANQGLGGLTKYVHIVQIGDPQFSGIGEKVAAEMNVEFEALYMAALAAPDVAL